MPSEKVLAQKQKQVQELAEQFRQAQSVVVSEFVGLNVEEDTELRTELRKANVKYKVIKNTIASRAIDDAGLADLVPLFVGSTSVAWSDEDAVAPAKILRKFSRQFDELKIKGGAVEGKVMSLEELARVADIPSVNELYGKIVGSLISPIASLAMVLNSIASKLAEEGKENVADLVTGAAEADQDCENSGADEAKEVAAEETPEQPEPEAADKAESDKPEEVKEDSAE